MTAALPASTLKPLVAWWDHSQAWNYLVATKTERVCSGQQMVDLYKSWFYTDINYLGY